MAEEQWKSRIFGLSIEVVGVLLVLNDYERGSSLCMLYHIDAVSRLADSPFASVHFRLFRTAFDCFLQYFFSTHGWFKSMGRCNGEGGSNPAISIGGSPIAPSVLGTSERAIQKSEGRLCPFYPVPTFAC